MLGDKVISSMNFNRLKHQLTNKKNPVLVVPELVIEYSWSYEEIVEIGYDKFIDALKAKIDEALVATLLKH